MVRKAVIPIAGLGARMRPISAVVPKALLPLVDAAGCCRAVIHWILADAADAGIEQAALVVSPGRQQAVETYLDAAGQGDDAADLPEVVFIDQPAAAGFGDAVLQAESFVGPEPFVVLLGDHVHVANAGAKGCLAQVTGAFEGYRGAAMVGMQIVGPEEVSRVGVAAGEPIVPGHVYRCCRLIEKPSVAAARDQLVTPDLAADRFLAHAGIYIFKPEIFVYLRELADDAERTGELGLTDAQQRLLARRPDDYYLTTIAGRVYDVGHPAGYADAQQAFRADR